jgi:GTP cyclohydrolase I
LTNPTKCCIITYQNATYFDINQKGTTMSQNHEAIKTAFETYIAENEKFTTKGVKAAAARARKALQEMSKGIKERRKEITAEKEALAVK